MIDGRSARERGGQLGAAFISIGLLLLLGGSIAWGLCRAREICAAPPSTRDAEGAAKEESMAVRQAALWGDELCVQALLLWTLPFEHSNTNLFLPREPPDPAAASVVGGLRGPLAIVGETQQVFGRKDVPA